MKKMILLALAIIPIAGWAQSSNFTINVKIDQQATQAKAYLGYPVDGKIVLDSTTIEKGKFTFKGAVSAPVNAELLIDHKGVGLAYIQRHGGDILSLYIDKGIIDIVGRDSIKTAVINGSAINRDYNKYKSFISAPEKAIAMVNTKYMTASDDKKKDPYFNDSLRADYNNAIAERQRLQQLYIKENPDSYLSLVSLTEIAKRNMDVAIIEPAFKSLSADIRKSTLGLELEKSIELINSISIGAMAPDFVQNDTNGKPVKLSDFKGKYVLLDFWASWCGPCRAENPNVVKAYHQYQNKNFTVLGVSLDQTGKKDKWLAAIKADGLDWTEVSDLKFWDNEAAKKYGIKSIPQNFLIDPAGKIIGMNLRGDELNEKLSSLFN